MYKKTAKIYNLLKGCLMNSLILKRVLDEANYMLITKETIREVANVFNVSKSTVHKDLHERLRDINFELFEQIDSILKYHIDVRHIRGGQSTKKKYEKLDLSK
jgi:putative DeoR family transcriptional regulator (stage III sporulation protein D)